MTKVLPRQRINLPYWKAVNQSLDEWLIRIPLVRPFTWKPMAGYQLLLDATRHGSSMGSTKAEYSIDEAVDATVMAVSRLYSTNPTSTFGWIDKGEGAVVGFIPAKSAGAVPLLDLTGVPILGNGIQLGIQRARPNTAVGVVVGFSDQQWSGLTLPFDLAGIGAPECSLLAGLNVVLVTTTDGDGVGTLPLSLPQDKSLLLQSVYFQGMIIDPPANQAGLAWTNGVKAILGGKF
jgi:hypothetical protein